MTFMILPPAASLLESYIRNVGAASLPKTQNFWFEDISQIPAKLQLLPFQVLTDYPNEPHEFYLDEKLYKRFVPATTASTLNLVFNPGVYTGQMVHPRTGATAEITFQISVRELIWWAWIQQLLGPMQRLENLEQRYNSPLHLAVFEASYPQDILAVQSSQWSVRSFAQAGHLKNVAGSTRTFVSGLLGMPVDTLSPTWELHDRRSDFSQALFPFADSTISRRSAFLGQDFDVVTSSSWNHGVLGDREAIVIPQVAGSSASLKVRVHTNGLAVNPASIEISGFHHDRRRFNLGTEAKFKSTIAGLVTVVNSQVAGDSSIILTVSGGSIDLKRHCLLRVSGLAEPVQLLSDLVLGDGSTGSISIAVLGADILAGSLVGLYTPNYDFPTLGITTTQVAGNPYIRVVPTANGFIQAGARIVFNDDPTVYTIQEPLALVVNQEVTLSLSPAPDVVKYPGQGGYPFRVTTTQVSSTEYDFDTSAWFIAESVEVYCKTDLGALEVQNVSIYPGVNVIDF